jgi:hypothetical protein
VVRTRRWFLAAPLAAAAVVAAVVLVPEPANAAHVRERTSAALDGVLDAVVYASGGAAGTGEKYFQPGDEGLSERWWAADGSSFRYRASVGGKPVVDLSRDSVADVFVDYRTRTYRAFPGTELSDEVWTPEELKQALAGGRVRVVGPGSGSAAARRCGCSARGRWARQPTCGSTPRPTCRCAGGGTRTARPRST